MTTPNVRCTCTGTCHPETPDYGDISEDQTPEAIAAQVEAADRRFAARVLAATDHIGRGSWQDIHDTTC